MAAHGYDSVERIAYWTQRLRETAGQAMTPQYQMEQMLREVLADTYHQMIEKGQIGKFHQGVERFTIDKLRPELRAELDRRIMSSANLIKLNREDAIATTLRRFQGWATSIPKGGSRVVDKPDEKKDIRKAIKKVTFEERRVLIDQSAKLIASINDIIATDGGAIAAIWRHVGKRAGYDPRPEHLRRSGSVFLIRGSWAQKEGLVKPGKAGYTDQIEQPAEWVFCSCGYEYVYNLRDVPPEMLTAKGRKALEEVRKKIAAMA